METLYHTSVTRSSAAFRLSAIPLKSRPVKDNRKQSAVNMTLEAPLKINFKKQNLNQKVPVFVCKKWIKKKTKTNRRMTTLSFSSGYIHDPKGIFYFQFSRWCPEVNCLITTPCISKQFSHPTKPATVKTNTAPCRKHLGMTGPTLPDFILCHLWLNCLYIPFF